jgi:hypothetical protein
MQPVQMGTRKAIRNVSRTPPRRRAPTERERIREIFLQGRASYGAGEVPEILGLHEAAVRQAIDQGAIAAIPDGAEVRIAWEDVVALGLEHRWTLRMLTAALRGLDGASLPDLVRVRPGQVVLPRYQWQVLHLLAVSRAKTGKRNLTVSDLLEEAISTAFLSNPEDWDRLEELLPGVRAAATWPSSD